MSLPLLPTPLCSIAAVPAYGQISAGTEAHLWLLDTHQLTAAHSAEAAQIMSDSEHQRARKMLRGRETYVASRWLMRKVLALYTGSAAAQIDLQRTDKGKPYLAHSNIHFSLSHSGHWAVLAIATSSAIGVDIEATKTTRDLTGIAEHYYHPQEFAQLRALSGARRQDYFYRLWTLKEAFFKATGTGISAGLDKILFKLDKDAIHAEIAAELEAKSTDWQFHQWRLSTEDYCALAYKAPRGLQTKWFDALNAPAFS